MRSQGYKQKDIARTIGKDKSVVSREISRNCNKLLGYYNYHTAQGKYEKRMKKKPKRRVFTEAVREYVNTMLKEKYSPEQIVGVARKEGKKCVSHERIYQHIWKDKKQGGGLYLQLRTEGKRYRKRGSKNNRRGMIRGRVDISQRPPEVENRNRIGDLEIDTIIGKNQQGAIVTINDRASGMVKMLKVKNKNATIVAKQTICALQAWKPYLKTITSDNGTEFAGHQNISQQLGVDFYFAKPYHSWERGSNENINGLIRQYIPKKTDFSTLSDEYVKWVEIQLNNRPRKRFTAKIDDTKVYTKRLV
jgi:IS30 family transposase